MYIITTGLNPHDEYICHYGRKGMKWGEHIYSRDDIKRLKKFMRTKEAKASAREFKRIKKEHFEKLGYKEGLFSNRVEKGSELARYTSAKKEKPSQRLYASMNKSYDDAGYYDMAKKNQLGSKQKEQYKVVYTAESKLRVAKGKKVAKDIIHKYGDNDLKELWMLYKDLKVDSRAKYLYDVDSQDTYDMRALKKEMGDRLNKLLYQNRDVKLYIDEKYRKKGYDAIEDAEDLLQGVAHPLIVYDPEKKLKKKSSRRVL